MADEKIVEVYRAANAIEAHLFTDVLRAEGISAYVEGDMRQYNLGDIPLGWVTAPRIMAPESQREAARDLLMRLESGECSISDEDISACESSESDPPAEL